MVTEDYVSFETAKLLKEKGFDEPCHCLWNNPPIGGPYNSVDEVIMTYEDIDPEVVHHWYLCPTIQMVMKWLREVHKIFLNINFIPEHSCFTYRVVHNGVEEKFVVYPSTYEDACESAIRYCLENLI